MADASALGIHPPATVRIDMGGWVQDWPWDTVDIGGNVVLISNYVGRLVNVNRCLDDPRDIGRDGLVYYAYEHARQLPDGSWIFHGREDFTVTAGPPQPASVN